MKGIIFSLERGLFFQRKVFFVRKIKTTFSNSDTTRLVSLFFAECPKQMAMFEFLLHFSILPKIGTVEAVEGIEPVSTNSNTV